MRDHLVFLLVAPMASFGSYAGHVRRGSESVPLRSAILGLVGAALGIKRDDGEGQRALADYSIAVQALQPSTPLRDYHTVATIPTSKKTSRPATRRAALEAADGDENTIITLRDYRCDVAVGAALWGKGQWSLEAIAEALGKPRFPLYLGRKSCPLAAPLDAHVIKAPDPIKLLQELQIPEYLQMPFQSGKKRGAIWSDYFQGPSKHTSSESFPAEPINRETWTFGERTMWRFDVTDQPAGSEEKAQ